MHWQGVPEKSTGMPDMRASLIFTKQSAVLLCTYLAFRMEEISSDRTWTTSKESSKTAPHTSPPFSRIFSAIREKAPPEVLSDRIVSSLHLRA